MNFADFRNSSFYKVGRTRFDLKEKEFKKIDYLLIDTLPLSHIDESKEYMLEETYKRPGSLYHTVTTTHLRRALEVEKDYLPVEFRKLIAKQWQEVVGIVNKLNSTPVLSFLFIVPPGASVHKHRHGHIQTVTFCYSFDEEQVEHGDYLLMDGKHIDFPEENKFYFTFINNAEHEVFTSKWRFFFLHDFDEYVNVPTDIPNFKYVAI